VATSERVSKLKLLLGELETPTQKEFLKAPQLPRGLPKGCVVELLGPLKTEWLIQFLKDQPEFRIFWAERDPQILPTALSQRGLDLTRVTFGHLGEDLFLPLRRVLQSQLYQAVIAPQRFDEVRVLKTFQLLTEKSNSVLFLMGQHSPSRAWPISVQLEIQKDPAQVFKVEVLKHKYGAHES